MTRVIELERICALYGVPLAAAALQFPLAQPAVAGVVAGFRSRAEAERSVALLAQPISTACWDALSSARRDLSEVRA